MLTTLPLYRGIYARNFKPQNLPADQITNVLYAFANFQDDGTV